MLDPGHGTVNFEGRVINSGKTTKSGYQEHRLNLEIAEHVGKVLSREGAQVFFTRTSHDYWRESYSSTEDNKVRALFANEVNADATISIHCDWHPNRRVRGVTTLYAKPKSKKLGLLIQKYLVKYLKTRNRKLVFEDFTVLDNAEMPAVIIETGFLSHRKESNNLRSVAYQQKIANAVTTALIKYFE